MPEAVVVVPRLVGAGSELVPVVVPTELVLGELVPVIEEDVPSIVEVPTVEVPSSACAYPRGVTVKSSSKATVSQKILLYLVRKLRRSDDIKKLYHKKRPSSDTYPCHRLHICPDSPYDFTAYVLSRAPIL